MTILDLKSLKTKSNDPYTLEALIEGLDDRGLLVLQVLLGQQAIKLLSERHIKQITKPTVIKPDAEDTGTPSLSTEG